MKQQMCGAALAVLMSAGLRAANPDGLVYYDRPLSSMIQEEAMTAHVETFTGCVRLGAGNGVFLLTHASPPAATMPAAAMPAAGDAAASPHMKGRKPASLALRGGTGAEFRKHLGHQVIVTGTRGGGDMNEPMGSNDSLFTVRSIRLVATKCQ